MTSSEAGAWRGFQAGLEREAHDLLLRQEFRAPLARHGHVEVVGALGMGLLCTRDIDLHLYPRSMTTEGWMGVVADLARTPGVQCMRLHNLWDHGPPDFAWRPPGLPRHRGYLTELQYVILRGMAAGWHVDLWLQPESAGDEAVQLRERVRAAQRADLRLGPAVLAMKAALRALDLPRRIPSLYVYLAALGDGVRALPALADALRRRGVALADVLEAALAASGPSDASGA